MFIKECKGKKQDILIKDDGYPVEEEEKSTLGNQTGQGVRRPPPHLYYNYYPG